MKLNFRIASGLVFNVFSLRNGRVLKVQRSKLISLVLVVLWGVLDFWRVWSWKKDFELYLEHHFFCYDWVLENVSNLELVGNLKKVELGFEQDFVKVLKISDFEIGVELIDLYVENILECLRFGFLNYDLKFKNYGLNDEGGLILLDLGELVFDYEEVVCLVEKKFWRRLNYFKFGLRGELKKYFLEVMEKNVCVENLEKVWRINCR